MKSEIIQLVSVLRNEMYVYYMIQAFHLYLFTQEHKAYLKDL